MIYTLVGHSGYWATGHDDFCRAVEEKGVTDKPNIRARILENGGVVFTDYAAAVDAAEAANYADDNEGLIPRARGFWSRSVRYDGLPLFVPDSDIRTLLVERFGAETASDPFTASERTGA